MNRYLVVPVGIQQQLQQLFLDRRADVSLLDVITVLNPVLDEGFLAKISNLPASILGTIFSNITSLRNKLVTMLNYIPKLLHQKMLFFRSFCSEIIEGVRTFTGKNKHTGILIMIYKYISIYICIVSIR